MPVVGDGVLCESRHGAGVGRAAGVVGCGSAGVDTGDEGFVGWFGGEGAKDSFGHRGATYVSLLEIVMSVSSSMMCKVMRGEDLGKGEGQMIIYD